MNQSSDIGSASAKGSAEAQIPPANWREALMALIAARFALIEFESKDAAKHAAKRIAMVAAAGICGIFAWVLLLAGGISLIAQITGCRWYLVTIGAALLHLIAGVIFASMAKPSAPSAFPVTRAEFQKDREWIENFHKAKKSND